MNFFIVVVIILFLTRIAFQIPRLLDSLVCGLLSTLIFLIGKSVMLINVYETPNHIPIVAVAYQLLDSILTMKIEVLVPKRYSISSNESADSMRFPCMSYINTVASQSIELMISILLEDES